MKNKIARKRVTLTIRKNDKDEYRIERDGKVIRSYEENELTGLMATNIALNLASNISKKEKISVTIRDAFSKSIQVCANCGAENVDAKAWQNLSTGKTEYISSDEEDTYCHEGCGHQGITTKDVKLTKEGREIFTIIA